MIKKKVVIEKADRLYQMPPEILSLSRSSIKPSLLRRTDQIDLASFVWPVAFDPELTISSQALAPASSVQLAELRASLADWMARQYRVKLNPDREILIGGSIASLIFSLALAFLENGDVAFVPEVGVPLYRKAVIACGAEALTYPITQKTNWTPDFDRININLRRVCQMLFLNSPHNPTGSELNEKELAHLITLAARENILIVSDAAYYSIPTRQPVSLLSMPGGKQVGVEVGSFSYHFGLPRLPFGFVAGNREVISALNLVTSLQPSYIPSFYVDLALRGIRQYPNSDLTETRQKIAASEAEASLLLDKLSLENCSGHTVPFVWAKIEKRSQSRNAVSILYRRSRVWVAPGTGFGDNGEGYLRFSLTSPASEYAKATKRIKRKISFRSSRERR